MKLTDWYPADVKPKRIGVYRKFHFYSYWNGEFWGAMANTPKQAAKIRHVKSAWQSESWRGLAEEPK